MPKTHNAAGRSINWKSKKLNRPPEGVRWIWLTAEMLESPAWRAMRLAARKIVDRLMIEHCAHGGSENGNLITTYTDFVCHGVRRPSISDGITECEALGFIDVIVHGGSAYAEFRNPSVYSLAWLERKDGTPPVNRWKAFESVGDAKKAVRIALAAAKVKKPPAPKNKKPDTKTTGTGNGSVTSAGHANVTSLNKQPDTKALLLSRFSVGVPTTMTTIPESTVR